MSARGADALRDAIVWTITCAISAAILMVGVKMLDPTRANSKQAKQRKQELARRLGRSIRTNTYEEAVACDVVNPNDIDVCFSSIGGLTDVIDQLYELVILPLKRPELVSRGKLLRPTKGVLLYGPPGTGKTMLAKAIAKESGAAFINLRLSSLMSKWFGDAQKLVSAVFSLAYKIQPAIIFLDEAESFLGQRHGTEHEGYATMRTEFMTLWDGFTTDATAQVMVIAATNRPWELDEAILRRLPRTFEVGLPDASQREAILRVMLRGEDLESGFNVGQIAAATEGYSGSDLQELCRHAAFLPVRELLRLEREQAGVASSHTEESEESPSPSRPRALRTEDFIASLSSSRPSADVAADYGFRTRSARHFEAPRSDGRPGQPAVSLETLQLLGTFINAFARGPGAHNTDS